MAQVHIADPCSQSRSVDRRHAVLKYDGEEHTFKVKDLGSQNGTFVNDSQVSEDDFTPVQGEDQLRFGFDPLTYRLVKDDLCVVAQPDSEQQTRHTGDSVSGHTGDIVSGDTGKAKPWRKNWTVQPGIAECAGCLSEKGVQHTCGMEQQHEHEQSPAHHLTPDVATVRNSASVTLRAAGVWPSHEGAYPYGGSVGPEASQAMHAYANQALLYSSYAPEGVSYHVSAAEGQRFVAADDMFVGQRAGQYISNVYPDSRQQQPGQQHFALAQPVSYDMRDMAGRYMPVVAQQQQQQQAPLTVWGYQQQQVAGPAGPPSQHAIHSHSHICVTHTLTPPIYDGVGYINPNPSAGLYSSAPPQHNVYLRRNSQPCARCLVAVQQQPHYMPADVHRQYAPSLVDQRYTPPQFVSAFPAQAPVMTTGSQPHLTSGGVPSSSRLEPQTPTSAPPHTALTFTLALNGAGEPTGHVPSVRSTDQAVSGEEARDKAAKSTPAGVIDADTSLLAQAKSDERLNTQLPSSVSPQQPPATATVAQQPLSAASVVPLASSAAAASQQQSSPAAASQHQQPQPKRRGKLSLEGTPLYGVPSWWGEDDAEEPPTNVPPSQKLAPTKEDSTVSRPSSLEVSRQVKLSKSPQTPAKHATEVFTLAAGSSREPAAPLTPPEKDTGFTLFDTDKEPTKEDNSGGVQKSRSAGATPSNEALNPQPGFAFTIDFGGGEQQSSKHRERLQQRLLQDKKRDRKDKSGDGVTSDDSLTTPRKTPDDKPKQKEKPVHRPPSVGSPLTERRAAVQCKKYSLDSESDLLHTSRGDKSRTSLSKTTASQAQRPAALVASTKVNFSRSKSVGQKGDLGKDTGKAYLFSKMSHGTATPQDDMDSPTEPTEFDLYAEARLFNNRTKADTGDDDDIREDVSEAGTYTIEDHTDAGRHADDVLDVDDLEDVEAGGMLGLERPAVDSGHSTPQGGRSQTPTTNNVPLQVGEWRRYPDTGNMLLASTDAHAGSARTSSAVTEEEESEAAVPSWAGRPARTLPATVGSRSQTPDSVERTSKSGDKRVSSPQWGRGGRSGGRVLPTPPLCASPRSVQSPLVELKTLPTEVKDSTRDCATLSYAAGEGEKFTIAYDAPKWSGRSERQAGVMTDTAGRLTGRSLASIDTAVLLQPTEVVLKELEKRSAGKQNGRTAKVGEGHPRSNSARVHDSDSDDDSAQALILGGRAIVKTAPKPADRKSPSVGSAALTKSKPMVKSTPTKPGTFIKQSSKSAKGPTPTPGFAAEIDSDCDDSVGFVDTPSLSTGATLPLQTKVNRAFALRRDNSERLVEGRDSFNDGSGHSTSRSATASPRLDTHRTDASLGHEIVKRSRANARKAESSLYQSGSESDDGEHTQSSYGGGSVALRQVRSAESKSASVSRTSSGAANKRAVGVAGPLVVSGKRPQTAKRSQTSPSPEYEAWRRRKDYNPQRSAAQGRTKGQGLKPGGRGQGQRPLSSSRSSVSSEGSGAGDDIDSYIRQHHHQPVHMSSNIAKGFSAFTHDLEMLTKASYDCSAPDTKGAPNSAMLSMIEQLSLSVSNQAIDIMARLMERDSSISSRAVEGLYEAQSEATILVDIYNNLRTTEHCLHELDRALLVKSPSPPASSPRHSDLHRSSTFPLDSLDTARGSPWTAARERLEGADDYY